MKMRVFNKLTKATGLCQGVELDAAVSRLLPATASPPRTSIARNPATIRLQQARERRMSGTADEDDEQIIEEAERQEEYQKKKEVRLSLT